MAAFLITINNRSTLMASPLAAVSDAAVQNIAWLACGDMFGRKESMLLEHTKSVYIAQREPASDVSTIIREDKKMFDGMKLESMCCPALGALSTASSQGQDSRQRHIAIATMTSQLDGSPCNRCIETLNTLFPGIIFYKIDATSQFTRRFILPNPKA